MKTHLPHGLRAALLAVLASVSITSYAAAAGLEGWPTPSGTKATKTVDTPTYDCITSGAGNLDLTINPASGFNRSTADRLFVLASNYTGNIYATVNNSPFGYASNSYYFVGMKWGNYTLNGDLNIRSVGGTTPYSGIGTMLAVDHGSTVNGNVYMGLDDRNTYSGGVYAVKSSKVTKTSKLEIASGTFNGRVAVGLGNASEGLSLLGGTELRISEGSFTNEVVAGSYTTTQTTTIGGIGTNLVIKGGTFNGNVIAGNTGTGTSTITGGTHLTISGGTFNGNIYGGSMNTGGNSSIKGGVDMMITGGRFTGKIYGAGTDDSCPIEGNINITIAGTTTFAAGMETHIYARGAGVEKVNGDINLTISGDDIKFGNANYTIFSLGADNGTSRSAPGTDTLTLAHLTGESELAKETTGGKQFRFEGTKDSTLELSDVNASIKKDIGGFTNMVVKDGSHVTLDTDANPDQNHYGNKTLGGATTVTVENGSTLTSEGISVSGRDEKGATITKGSTATLATATKIQDAKVELAGTASINTQMENVDLVNAKAGTTMTVNNISGTQNTATVSSNATVNLMNIGEGKDGILKELNISGEGKLGVYINGTAAAGNNDANVGNLTLASGGKITIGAGGGTLEANLTTESGSTLDFSAGVALTMGCDLNVGGGTCIMLSGSDFDSLVDGGTVTLFTGVDNEINPEMAASDLIICRVTEAEGEKDVEVLSDQVSFYTDENKNAVLTLTSNVPEPATGTLSLLALAGLCARRRRKH